jgi:hypothetical protein
VESPTNTRGNSTGKQYGQADRHRDENHALDGSQSKDEQVDFCQKGSRIVPKTRSATAAEPASPRTIPTTSGRTSWKRRCIRSDGRTGSKAGIAVVPLRIVAVPLQIDIIAVNVRMRVNLYFVAGSERKTAIVISSPSFEPMVCPPTRCSQRSWRSKTLLLSMARRNSSRACMRPPLNRAGEVVRKSAS